MATIIINGKENQKLAGLLGDRQTFVALPANPSEVPDDSFAGATISVTASANAAPGLTETMSSRSFFEKVKNLGVTTLMHAVAAKEIETNWMMYMGMVLPYVDVYFSTYNDALYLFEQDLYEEYKDKTDAELCDQIALSILNMGCALTILDLGADGIYLRSSSVKPRLESMGVCSPSDVESWWARELYTPACSECNASTEDRLAGLVNSLTTKELPEAFCKTVTGASCAVEQKKNAPAATFASWKENNSILFGPYDKVEA